MSESNAIEKRPDIVIGLVAAAGTNLQPIKGQIEAQLAALNYRSVEIKLSKLIAQTRGIDTSMLKEHERIEKLMDAGDEIRRTLKRGDGVISLATTAIQAERGGETEEGEWAGDTAYILDSLKTPQEIDTLRRVYGPNFVCISVYSPKSKRVEKLANRIASSQQSSVDETHIACAKELIGIDEHRDQSKFTQDVREAFPKADFFVDLEGPYETEIKRFIELLFGEPFTTPTFDEFCMYLAKAAALRSSDLSRQVGAVIGDGSVIISTGTNEVPYPGGGFFVEGGERKLDNRDYTVEFDPNASQIESTVKEFVSAFKKVGAISDEFREKSDAEIARSLMHGSQKEIFKETRVRNLIEFGRVVHAEMTALTEAARVGRSVKGATLYCTTFPCHLCAKHIIAAGIDKVVFIEPYPKSLTPTLYSREIEFEDNSSSLDAATEFSSFRGVSPTIFQRLFEHRPRKNSYGSIVRWDGKKAIPQSFSTTVSNPKLERVLSSKVDEILVGVQNENDVPGES